MTREQKGILAAFVATVVCFLAGGLIGFYWGRCAAPQPSSPAIVVQVDTVTVSEPATDSVIQVGTVVAQLPVIKPKPKPRLAEIDGAMDADEPMDTIDYGLPPLEPSGVEARDSAAVEIPISRYVAEKDSLYRVVASGYAVSFDEITVYPRTVTVTQAVVQQRRSRWGIGIHAGYGVTLNHNTVQLAPYIGVGVSYNIITW